MNKKIGTKIIHSALAISLFSTGILGASQAVHADSTPTITYYNANSQKIGSGKLNGNNDVKINNDSIGLDKNYQVANQTSTNAKTTDDANKDVANGKSPATINSNVDNGAVTVTPANGASDDKSNDGSSSSESLQTIQYVNDKDNIVGSQVFAGRNNDKLDPSLIKVPTGYKLADKSQLPTKFTGINTITQVKVTTDSNNNLQNKKKLSIIDSTSGKVLTTVDADANKISQLSTDSNKLKDQLNDIKSNLIPDNYALDVVNNKAVILSNTDSGTVDVLVHSNMKTTTDNMKNGDIDTTQGNADLNKIYTKLDNIDSTLQQINGKVASSSNSSSSSTNSSTSSSSNASSHNTSSNSSANNSKQNNSGNQTQTSQSSSQPATNNGDTSNTSNTGNNSGSGTSTTSGGNNEAQPNQSNTGNNGGSSTGGPTSSNSQPESQGTQSQATANSSNSSSDNANSGLQNQDGHTIITQSQGQPDNMEWRNTVRFITKNGKMVSRGDVVFNRNGQQVPVQVPTSFKAVNPQDLITFTQNGQVKDVQVEPDMNAQSQNTGGNNNSTDGVNGDGSDGEATPNTSGSNSLLPQTGTKGHWLINALHSAGHMLSGTINLFKAL